MSPVWTSSANIHATVVAPMKTASSPSLSGPSSARIAATTPTAPGLLGLGRLPDGIEEPRPRLGGRDGPEQGALLGGPLDELVEELGGSSRACRSVWVKVQSNVALAL
jgi:hypothetical protein